VIWTLEKEVQTLEKKKIWSIIYPLNHLSWHLYCILRKIFHGDNQVSLRPFDEAIPFLEPGFQQTLFVECGLAGWGVCVAGCHGTEVMDVKDWGNVLICPDKVVCDWHNLSISFLMTNRPNFLVEFPCNTLTRLAVKWNVSHACMYCWWSVLELL
jgi:hypothetical protein